MSVESVEVYGVQFDIYFSVYVEHDPLGVGDSPTEYEITIESAEVGGDTQDVYELLCSSTQAKILEAVTEKYLESRYDRC